MGGGLYTHIIAIGSITNVPIVHVQATNQIANHTFLPVIFQMYHPTEMKSYGFSASEVLEFYPAAILSCPFP